MITVIGANTIDYFCYTSRLPSAGETFIGDEMIIGPGGKGANQGAAAAKLGAEVCWLSKVGGLDRYKSLVLEGAKNAGVDICAVEEVNDVYCGAGFVTIDSKTGQNCITILHGANAFITPEYIDKWQDKIKAAQICMAELQIPPATAKYALTMAKKNGALTILNPAPAGPIDDDFYPYLDIITPNEVEAHSITGIYVGDKKSASEAAAFFHQKGVAKVVITLGSRGVFVSADGREEMIGARQVQAVDTSGAGDCFNGALAYFLQKEEDIFKAAVFANAAAAVSVTKKGTMDSMPELSEVLSMLERTV